MALPLPLLLLIPNVVALLAAATIADLSQPLAILTFFLSLLSGLIVGFSLGLIGGGGSIIAVPLLLYIVGMDDVHAAIGTSALAVGVIAAINAYAHKRKSNVNLKMGLMFALPGAAGAYLGAQVGSITQGNHLLMLFAALMAAVAVKMMVDSKKEAPKHKNLQQDTGNNANSIGRVLLHSLKGKRNHLSLTLPLGFAVGFAAGFFGIGGGFLIMPALLYSTDLTMAQAIGTSLVSVSTFGFTSASSYLGTGQVDLFIAAIFVVGGGLGGIAGAKYSSRTKNQLLARIFALVLIAVALYVTYRGLA